MTLQKFTGTIEVWIDSDIIKGEFLESHNLNENDFNDRNKIKSAIENEVYSWLECMNIDLDLELK